MAKSAENKTVAFTYNHDGLRTKKEVTENGVTTATEYLLHGKLVTGLKQGNTELHFFYDAQSRPAAVRYNGNLYWYVHNLQGDIIAIVNASGQKVAVYRYDAWGKPLPINSSELPATYIEELSSLNPFRYRGYVWDQETGLYYLRSRYYNPVWGRFVNADTQLGSLGKISGHAVYCYCLNSPLRGVDPSGYSFFNVLKSFAINMVNMARSVFQHAYDRNMKTRLIGSKIMIKGKPYNVFDPREERELSIGPVPERIAHGIGSRRIFNYTQLGINISTYDASTQGLLYPFKDSICRMDIDVYVIQMGTLEPEAFIIATISRSITKEVWGGNVNSETTSEPFYIVYNDGYGSWTAVSESNAFEIHDSKGFLNEILESMIWE